MRNALTNARQIVVTFVALYIPMNAVMFWIQDMAIQHAGEW